MISSCCVLPDGSYAQSAPIHMSTHHQELQITQQSLQGGQTTAQAPPVGVLVPALHDEGAQLRREPQRDGAPVPVRHLQHRQGFAFVVCTLQRVGCAAPGCMLRGNSGRLKDLMQLL